MIRGLLFLALLLAPGHVLAQGPDEGFEELAARFTANWTVFERPGLRVLASDETRVHELALDALAAFVDTCLVRMDAPTRVRRELQAQPIHYYFCSDATQVRFLTGAATEGLALLPARAVVSKWLPHEHELVHVLAHMTAGGRAETYEPFLQEGLAAWWGGRGGEAPRIALQSGDLVLDNLRTPIATLLDVERFRLLSDPSRTAYAVSARLVQFLVARGGWKRFLDLYRLLGARRDGLAERPQEWVVLQIEGAYGTTWTPLLEEFDRWRRAHPVVGLELAGRPAGPAALSAADVGRQVRAWPIEDGSWVFDLRGGGHFPEGLVQWGATIPSPYAPRLLSRHAGGSRQRYGLMLRPDRIELYDYALERLIAELDPTPPEFHGIGDTLPMGVTVRIPAQLWRELEIPTGLTLTAPPGFEP